MILQQNTYKFIQCNKQLDTLSVKEILKSLQTNTNAFGHFNFFLKIIVCKQQNKNKQIQKGYNISQ